MTTNIPTANGNKTYFNNYLTETKELNDNIKFNIVNF
jgi:hypothetical protein